MLDNHSVSSEHPDWSREHRNSWTWEPSRSLIGCLRAYQSHKLRRGVRARMLRVAAIVRHRFWSAVTGADIPLNCKIGGGLLMPHPNGVVIHPDASIGPNCLIFQQATIGASRRGVPTVGGHVDIGAGAKIIGPVKIGDHVVIGVNAVVVFDVPDGATVVSPVGIIK